jgi:hypothetical protein
MIAEGKINGGSASAASTDVSNENSFEQHQQLVKCLLTILA